VAHSGGKAPEPSQRGTTVAMATLRIVAGHRRESYVAVIEKGSE
jgi:hypothetical protein